VAPQPVIVEAAINGANPVAPRHPGEIAADALACLAAGASIVHNHIDRYMAPADEVAERYLEGWRPVWAERPDALLYPTINGGPVADSLSHLPALTEAGCRIGIIDPGSVNLGGSFVYVNSGDDIAVQRQVCEDLRLGPSIAIFEPGFLRTALRLHADGRLPAGAMVKLYFCDEAGYVGGVFGLPPTRPSFDAYLSMLDGVDLPWSAAVIGGDVVSSGVARWALDAGGHLHVGLEDHPGGDGVTNGGLVEAAAKLCAEVGRPLATTDDTIRILGLPTRA
jgi:uncharacterized protein (DUF849 family)